MKTLKYFLSTLLVISFVWSCANDELNNLDFLDSSVAPTKVDALLTITQDNTGLVTIAPSAEGAVVFDINFGDASAPETIKVGKKATHTYAEGNYTVKIIAKGITGLSTEITKELPVSFNAPEFVSDPETFIKNDPAISKKVNVTIQPDDVKWTTFFDVHFVEDGVETILTGNLGNTVSYTYANAGLVDIKIVIKGGAIATTEYIKTDFEVTEILQPIASAPTQPGRQSSDYISIFSDAYTDIPGTNFNPWWWQSTIYTPFDLNGDAMLQYSNLNYQGIEFGADVDAVATSMEYVHIDIWSPDVTAFEFYLISRSSGEKYVLNNLVKDQWNSFDIPLSAFTDQGLTLGDIFQFKIVGSPWAPNGFGSIFVDNLYFWKTPSEPSPIAGTWKIAPEAYALMVGDSYGSGNWWGNSAGDVTTRACLFDDQYVFGSDGSFKNVLGGSTWIETWQGVEGCGTPVAPHDGTVNASFYYDEALGKLTVTGKGAYLGIPKPYNGGELTNPADAPDSITYDIVLSDNGNTMTLVLYYGVGYWTFKLVRDLSPIVGNWKIAPEAYALMVGDSYGSGNWWGNSAGDVTTRACLFDDQYVFQANSVFKNIQDSSTWIENWQGTEGCGAPVSPHDGSALATYSYDENAGTVTVIGTGAYLGIPKPYNGGELSNPADAPGSITYDVSFSDGGNTMTLVLYYGVGYWTFKLVK